MERRPVIIGVGRTKFGEHYETEPSELMEEAGLKALNLAGMERRDLDACYFSDCFLQVTNKIGIEEGFLSEMLELHIPMERMRSFSSALQNACHTIQSRKYDLVFVGGVEKMSDRWDKIWDDLMLLEDPWSYYAGCTPEANHELMLREYIKKYKISGEKLKMFNTSLAQISVKNHHYASKNEYAQFRRDISVNNVLKERSRVRKPLGRYDFAPISDGATALILASSDIADKYASDRVCIAGASSATDYITFPSREDRTGFIASRIAMKNALEMAKIEVNDIQIAELYDQSTLLEMIALEDLGFSKKGEAWIDVNKSLNQGEHYEIDRKKLYVNVNGGLKADGNPFGATGGAQIFEVTRQLLGEAGDRQVESKENLQVGCILEFEGFGTKAYVHILRRS